MATLPLGEQNVVGLLCITHVRPNFQTGVHKSRGQYVVLINKSLVTAQKAWSIKHTNFKGIYNCSSLPLALDM